MKKQFVLLSAAMLLFSLHVANAGAMEQTSAQPMIDKSMMSMPSDTMKGNPPEAMSSDKMTDKTSCAMMNKGTADQKTDMMKTKAVTKKKTPKKMSKPADAMQSGKMEERPQLATIWIR